ncbi:MAG: hypothetical protein J5680_01560 [Neisseriaceae bacterium]|nr:hypothetical protein [Neisseriaceae bacterium]
MTNFWLLKLKPQSKDCGFFSGSLKINTAVGWATCCPPYTHSTNSLYFTNFSSWVKNRMGSLTAWAMSRRSNGS